MKTTAQTTASLIRSALRRNGTNAYGVLPNGATARIIDARVAKGVLKVLALCDGNWHVMDMPSGVWFT